MSNGTNYAGESLLGPAPVAVDRRQALLVVLKSGVEQVVVHDGDPLSAPREGVLGKTRYAFADGSFLDGDEVAYAARVSVADAEARLRAANRPEAPVPVQVVGAVPATAEPDDNFAAWTTADLEAEAARLNAMDPRGAQESLDLAAISAELVRRKG